MFKKHLPKKYTPIIMVALALLALLVVAIVAGLDSKLDFIWDNKTPTSTPEASIDISNWKTYRNEEYGFEFKYPEGWKMYQKALTSFVPPLAEADWANLPILGVGFFDKSLNQSINDWIDGTDFLGIKENNEKATRNEFVSYGFFAPQLINNTEYYFGRYSGGGSMGVALINKGNKVFVLSFNFVPYTYDSNGKYIEAQIKEDEVQKLFIKLLKTIKIENKN